MRMQGEMAALQVENMLRVLGCALGCEARPLERPDWKLLAQIACEQSMTALFYQGALQYPEFASCPPDLREELQRQTIVTVATQIQRTQRLGVAYRALREAGLRPIVFKGILCRCLYGALADYRPSSDEDIYLAPEYIVAAHEVLEREGWRLSSHPDSLKVPDKLQAIEYEDRYGVLALEVHSTLFGTASARQDLWNRCARAAASRPVRVVVEGEELWALEPTAHYLCLFLHVVKHLCGAGVGLRMIVDLMLFQKVHGAEIRWGELVQQIEALGLGGLYADTMAVGRRLGFKADPLFREVAPQALLEDLACAGVFGQARRGKGRGAILTIAAQHKSIPRRLQWLLVPSVKQLVNGRPWLAQRPWLLPLAWVQRASLLFRGDEKHSRVSLGALVEAQGRTKLLRAYGLCHTIEQRQTCRLSG